MVAGKPRRLGDVFQCNIAGEVAFDEPDRLADSIHFASRSKPDAVLAPVAEPRLIVVAE
jgi:hypothetical protein